MSSIFFSFASLTHSFAFRLGMLSVGPQHLIKISYARSLSMLLGFFLLNRTFEIKLLMVGVRAQHLTESAQHLEYANIENSDAHARDIE
jgi:hypothetical protein